MVFPFPTRWPVPKMGRVPPGGTVLANGEDANTIKALEGKEGVLTFGLEKGTFHAENLTWDHGFPSFDVVWNGKPAVHVALQVPGEHNVKTAPWCGYRYGVGRHRSPADSPSWPPSPAEP